MDIKDAFLNTAHTLLHAMMELSQYRIVGLTVQASILSVHVAHRDRYIESDLPAIEELNKITPNEFNCFKTLFQESSIIIAYSWLDTFLSELEEALFLHNPLSMGENVQIKFGKIISSPTIEDLVHDIAKRKTREKGGWSLKNRILELKNSYKIETSVTEKELEWVSESRNTLVHNRRIGDFKITNGKVEYELGNRWLIKRDEQIQYLLAIIFALLADLYIQGAEAIGITLKLARHRQNIELATAIKQAYPKEPS